MEDFNLIDSDTFTAFDNAADTLGQFKNIDLVPRAAYPQTVLIVLSLQPFATQDNYHIPNHASDIRLSTLMRIVQEGLGVILSYH